MTEVAANVASNTAILTGPPFRRPGRMRMAALVVLAVVPAACVAPPSPSAADGTLEVRVVAGPVCPVETVPPDPACEPRAVAGARIFVSPGDGRDILVAQGTSDDNGTVRLDLPPGAYIVTGAEVEGLFGLPQPVQATVRSADQTSVTLAYDTGIR